MSHVKIGKRGEGKPVNAMTEKKLRELAGLGGKDSMKAKQELAKRGLKV